MKNKDNHNMGAWFLLEYFKFSVYSKLVLS